MAPTPDPHLTMRSADWAQDSDTIKDLCWEYHALLDARTKDFPGLIERYYAHDVYAALLEDLPRIHARPKGDIVVAQHSGEIVGCAMYYPLNDTGLCEIKRVFVTPAARGLSAGHALMQTCMQRAAEDGHHRMVLDTMIELTEAIKLYEKLGFTPAEPFYDLAPEVAHAIRFFGHDLIRP
ncbi:MAG: GNAT family N-acetyltransferase [Aliishimia sp.]